MSRTGKKPIPAVGGVNVAIKDRVVTAKGPKGEQSLALMDVVNVEQTDEGLVVVPVGDTAHARAAWGTTRALIANMVKGVSEGFEKKLQIQGVGFRARARTSSSRSVSATKSCSRPRPGSPSLPRRRPRSS
jgi:large subunit ribosomal protein L6